MPPLTSPVSFVRTMRGPSSVMSALMFSAAMLGSSLTALASLSVTVPLRSGLSIVPRARSFSVVSPSACTRSISTEIAPALMFPSTLTFNARSPTSPTSPVAAMVPAEPVSSICWSVATPDAMAIVEICFWASSRALNVSASSGNFTVPLERRQIGASRREIRFKRDDAAERGRRARNRRRVEPLDRRLQRGRSAHAGNLDRQRRHNLERNAARGFERRRAPVAGQRLDAGFTVGHRGLQLDVREAGLEQAATESARSRRSRRDPDRSP